MQICALVVVRLEFWEKKNWHKLKIIILKSNKWDSMIFMHRGNLLSGICKALVHHVYIQTHTCIYIFMCHLKLFLESSGYLW